MQASRDDFVIAIRSAFLKKENKQKFSLVALIFLTFLILISEKFSLKPVEYLKISLKEVAYRSTFIVSIPENFIKDTFFEIREYTNFFKDFKLYIIDSKIDSSTKKMIKVFEDKISKSEFRLFFNSKFINNTNQCIDHLINTSKLFRDSVKELSNDTLHNFQEMIPEKLKHKWKEGIKNDSYYMKLCGSGGGGFFLAYDFDNQINSSFSDFKIYQI